MNVKTILSFFFCFLLTLSITGVNLDVETEEPFQHGWTGFYQFDDWINYVQIFIKNYENQSTYVGTELIIEFDILETQNIAISGSRFQCSADIHDIGEDQYNISISYTDNLTNSYSGNYTYDKTLFGIFTEPVRLKIMDDGIKIDRNWAGNAWSEDEIYFYNESGPRGWLFAAININTDDEWSVNIRTERREDAEIGGLSGFLGLLAKYTPYSSESLTILQGFGLVLKLSIVGLKFLMQNTLYILLFIEAIFLFHASQKKDLAEIYQSLLNDNIRFFELLLGFFRGLINLIIKIVEMINPF